MNSARIELKLVLDQAGIDNISLDTFSQRFNIQKRIYLIQIMGYDLGYRYGWYLRGPYSRNLTVDAFTLRDELNAEEKDYAGFKLSPESTERIGKAKELWDVPNGLSVSNDQWLELLASLHYLKHIAYWPNKDTTKDFEGVFTSLVETKPHFKNYRTDAQRAWERLSEFGLLNAKTLA